MKKILSVLLIVAMMMTVFVGCQENDNKVGDSEVSSSTESEDITMVFATNETPILTKEFWQIPADKFMSENPNIKIKNIAQPSSNIMHRDFLKTLLATGEFPDVMVMASPMDFVAAGALMSFDPAELEYTKDPSVGKIDGKNYIVPYKKMVGGIWYNKDLFKDKGLEVPDNYDDFIALCQSLQDEEITPIAMGLKDGWPQLILASCMLSTDLLSEDSEWGLKRNNNETTYSSEDFKYTMDKFSDVVTNYSNTDLASVSYAQMLELFFSEKAAMIPMGSWFLGEEQRVNPDFEVGFFPFPSDDGKKTVPVWVNEGLAINSKTEHPEEAKAFVKFFMTEKAWYGEFLKTEMLFPTTKEDIPYEMSALRKEIGNHMSEWHEVEHWYDMTGDAALLPGLQTYFNKMTQNIAMGADVEEELKLFDQEWEMAKSNLNN